MTAPDEQRIMQSIQHAEEALGPVCRPRRRFWSKRSDLDRAEDQRQADNWRRIAFELVDAGLPEAARRATLLANRLEERASYR